MSLIITQKFEEQACQLVGVLLESIQSEVVQIDQVVFGPLGIGDLVLVAQQHGAEHGTLGVLSRIGVEVFSAVGLYD